MILANAAMSAILDLATAALVLPFIVATEALVIRKLLVPPYWSSFRFAFGANWRLHPIMSVVFRFETQKRLNALRNFFATKTQSAAAGREDAAE